MLIEELKTRKRTGIHHLSDHVLKQLMLSYGSSEKKKQGKQLEGCHSYDILAERDNAEKLQYVPHYYPERSKYIISVGNKENSFKHVDKVRVAVDFAYLDEERAKAYSFCDEVEE